MDTEFHYYVTGIIARAAGFSEEEAALIANACEFVDENDTQVFVKDQNGGEPYESYISQTMNILKPKQRLMRIYPVFHFVPGEPDAATACRRDGKMHLLNTTPDNEIANELLDEAFKAPGESRLYRIGIASHSFADTWAHQNFVGWYDYFNNVGLDPKPDIGHADGEHLPDWVAHRWEDCRLKDDAVCNNSRFLEAAEKLYRKYSRYQKDILKRDPVLPWDQLSAKLINLMGISFSGHRNYNGKERLKAYRVYAPWLGDFDETEWFRQAIETEVHGFKDLPGGLGAMVTFFKDKYFWREDVDREETHWFRFQEAVKEHQKMAMERLQPRFAKMGIDLKQH